MLVNSFGEPLDPRPWKRSASRSSGGEVSSVDTNPTLSSETITTKRVRLEKAEPVAASGPKLINYESLEELQKRLLQSPAADQWIRIGIRHHHGITVPLFSLRTETSGAVGEYPDLTALVDWIKLAKKFDVVQLLPLNANNSDNSPFAPRSCYSLNPLLLSLTHLPKGEEIVPKPILNALKELNKNNSVQWREVSRLKTEALRAYFKHPDSQQLLKSADCQNYLEANSDWLEGFAVFSVLKSRYQEKPWDQWPVKLSHAPAKENEKTFDQLRNTCDTTELNYHKFLQFLCHQQLSAARKYANERKVFLKGDVPFLVAKDSADVWQHQDMFLCDVKVGAPPDVFSAEGQDWGLPMYDWKNSTEKLLSWWNRRLAIASQYYDIYRIDHIAGFFRVWAIPLTAKSPKEGSFVPATETEWCEQGEKLLRAILKAAPMLPIGEDLGAVPHVARDCLQRLGICGTKVMRWERDWEKPNKPYLPISSYNSDSMTTVSTHDSETLELWWANQRADVEEYCRYKGWNAADESPADPPSAKLSTTRRRAILRDSHRSPSLFHINPLGEYLALIPSLVYDDARLERVNVPGTLADYNWAYRMRPTLAELSANTQLLALLKEILL